ncbi:MAG: hypothetical protein JO271_01035 [Verrucomicrobia bacterium]|nr:hypothetical protein [Verrucomicrobiota bacterium]
MKKVLVDSAKNVMGRSLTKDSGTMEPENSKSQLSAHERLARDSQREAILLRNVVWLTLWTLLALIPSMLLLFVEMSAVGRAITGILCALFWLLALRGMFRLAGLLDAGKRPISLNPFHAGKNADDAPRRNK